MTAAVTSRPNDTVDLIAMRHAARADAAAVAAILEANPGLADYGPALPEGVRVLIPDLPAEAPIAARQSLWGSGA